MFDEWGWTVAYERIKSRPNGEMDEENEGINRYHMEIVCNSKHRTRGDKRINYLSSRGAR